jgi:hypothetical protein
MYVNGKMGFVETIPEMVRGGGKERSMIDKMNSTIFDIL